MFFHPQPPIHLERQKTVSWQLLLYQHGLLQLSFATPLTSSVPIVADQQQNFKTLTSRS
jgi:hypothetical protein